MFTTKQFVTVLLPVVVCLLSAIICSMSVIVCLVSVIWLVAPRNINVGNLIVNSGFETMENTSGGPPVSYGDWNGDYSAIVGTTSGITPHGGAKMLQFKGTSFCDGGSSDTCEIEYICDISRYMDLVRSGHAVINASAWFNRVAGGPQTDTQLYVTLFAYTGSPGSLPQQREDDSHLALSTGILYSDSDITSWEKVVATLQLPAETDFVVIGLDAGENIHNDVYYPEFDGHFADDINWEIVPARR